MRNCPYDRAWYKSMSRMRDCLYDMTSYKLVLVTQSDPDLTSEYISTMNRTELITQQWTYLLNTWTYNTGFYVSLYFPISLSLCCTIFSCMCSVL